MPAFNEEENVEEVVKSWYSMLDGKDESSKLVVADSGSTDSTHAILEQLKTRYPKLEVLSETQLQHGPKVIALYNYAIQNNVDFVFQTDSDGQTNPDEFDSFWRQRNEYDGIFGVRKNREDGRIRAYVERIVCILLWLFFGVRVPDANAPFRLLKTKTVEKYLCFLDENFNIPNIIITAFFVLFKERYSFKLISFKARSKGTNSVNIWRILKTG